MRDIRTISMMMRDENVPATLSIFDDDIVVTTPMDLDENAKDKLVKRFAEHLLRLGLSLHDWKEKD